MLTLATGNTIQGVTTGAATAITYTIFGDALGANDSFQVLAQGQLPTSAAALYTVPGSTNALVKSMIFVNTTGAGVLMTIYVNGTAAVNSIGAMTIPANGLAMWTPAEGWCMRDANGSVVQTFVTNLQLTGDVTAGPGTSPLATTLATVNGSPGTFGSASNVAQIVVNGKGLATTVTNVPIVISSGSVTGLGSLATVSNLTGPVTSVGAATTIGAGAVTNSNIANQSANSIMGEFTGTASAPQDLSLTANTFPARASTGNIAAAPITNVALAFVGGGGGFLGSTSALFPKEIAGTAYVTAGNPQGWSGSDFGAWVNSAYAYLIATYGTSTTGPPAGFTGAGRIQIGPGVFTYTTPIVCADQWFSIKIMGCGSGVAMTPAANSGKGGTVLNYTPTSGIALTIAGASSNNGGVAIEDFALFGGTVGTVLTVPGGSAIGIQWGLTGGTPPPGSSTAGATAKDVVVAGFFTGENWNNSGSIAYAVTHINCKVQLCAQGAIPFGEANVWFGGLFGGNTTGLVMSQAGTDANLFGTAFDDNTTTAINVSTTTARLTLSGCRFENAGGGTDTYITQSAGSVVMLGGSMQSDVAVVGTSTGFVQGTGGTFYLHGTWLYNSSANRTFTQCFNFSSAMTSVKCDPVLAPSPSAFTAGQQLFNIATSVFPRQLQSPQTNVTSVTATSASTFVSADTRGGLPMPANARPGTRVRISANFSGTATLQALTLKAVYGTGNAATDATIISWAIPAATSTASAWTATFTTEITILTSTTAAAQMTGASTAGLTGAAAAFFSSLSLAAYATIATTSASFLGFYFESSVASIVTCRSVTWEILSN